jgi:hypothetical protein
MALFHTEQESPTRIAVYSGDSTRQRWATLERVLTFVFPAEYIEREDPLPEGYEADDPDDWEECATCHQSRWAAHTSTCEKDRERWQWIVRRFDWFDPTPRRDPTYQQAVSPDELRELVAILDKLNDNEKSATVSPTVLHECRHAYETGNILSAAKKARELLGIGIVEAANIVYRHRAQWDQERENGSE